MNQTCKHNHVCWSAAPQVAKFGFCFPRVLILSYEKVFERKMDYKREEKEKRIASVNGNNLLIRLG